MRMGTDPSTARRRGGRRASSVEGVAQDRTSTVAQHRVVNVSLAHGAFATTSASVTAHHHLRATPDELAVRVRSRGDVRTLIVASVVRAWLWPVTGAEWLNNADASGPTRVRAHILVGRR